MTPYPHLRTGRLALGLTACAMAAGCGSFDGATRRIADSVTPYKVQVVQGNFVSREQIEALRAGMSRQQVREVLGTPLVTSVFHADRWDYVFTLKRQGTEPQLRRLTLYFRGNVLDGFEGDPMPSEAEFVASLDSKRSGKPVPALEASADQLRQFGTGGNAAPRAPGGAPAASAAPTAYPPLEPPAR